MSTRDFAKEVKELLAKGDTEKALQVLRGYIEAQPDQWSDFEDEVILIANKVHKLNKKERQRLINQEDASLAWSRINTATLEIIRLMEAGKKPATQRTIRAKKSNRNQYLLFSFFIIAVLAIPGYYIIPSLFSGATDKITPSEVEVFSHKEQVTLTIIDTIPFEKLNLRRDQLSQFRIYPMVHPDNTNLWYVANPVFPSARWEATVNLGGTGVHSAKDGDVFYVTAVLSKSKLKREIESFDELLQRDGVYSLGTPRRAVVQRK